MEEKSESQVGRNEPCPCGSGKKYKRCHGVDAAPKLTAPKAPPAGAAPPMFDPSQLDPAMMQQLANAMRRLPRGQMQRLQAMMQKAMSGKDVSRESAEFERMLPPDVKAMFAAFQTQMASQMGMPADGAAIEAESAPVPQMSEEEARAIVAAAAAEGKISSDEASELLEASPKGVEPEGSQEHSSEEQFEDASGIKRLWRGLKKKA